MTMEKNINISVSSKVVVAAALGAGIVVGAGTAYLLTRIHEHSNLAHVVSNLHSTIREVKEDLANIENELGLLHAPAPLPGEKQFKKRHRKAVSFSSTTESYKTAAGTNGETSSRSFNDTISDTASWKTAAAYDTDYFSPDDDEEDEEFFDLSPPEPDESSSNSTNSQLDISISSLSEEVNSLTLLIKKVDSLIDRTPEEQMRAFDMLQDTGAKYENNAEILWRRAKAYRLLSVIEEKNGNIENRKEMLNKGLEYAEYALKINDKSADVHKWYAVLCGARGEFLSTKERIASGHIFKQHIDIALQICPNDSTLHYLLGRFCYEVSQLTWIERKIAATLFVEVPYSTYEDALSHFLAAEELKPSWKENQLFIAKCYLKLLNIPEAELWLKRAYKLPSINIEDELMDKEIEELSNNNSIEL